MNVHYKIFLFLAIIQSLHILKALGVTTKPLPCNMNDISKMLLMEAKYLHRLENLLNPNQAEKSPLSKTLLSPQTKQPEDI